MLQGFTSTSYHFNLNLFCIIITDHRNLQQSSQGTRTLVEVAPLLIDVKDIGQILQCAVHYQLTC